MITEIMSDKQYEHLSNEQLIKLYKSNPQMDIKQEIVLRYLYIVKSIAVQMRNVYLSFEQVDDVINEGVIMLMKAIDKFDPELNVKFETYIAKRVRGMVIDIARKQDWVPRTVRKSYNEISESELEFYTKNGRNPTEKEICEKLNIEQEKYRQIKGKSNLFNVLSLDMAIEESGEKKKSIQISSDSINEQPEALFLDNELKGILAEGIKKLKEKEQIVVSLYYVEEISMKEIAAVMQVSEPRVSQIHANALKKLREYILPQS